MKLNTMLVGSLMATVAFGVNFASFADVQIPTDKSKFKIVILAGQSNMAGRGDIDENDNKPHPRVVMQTEEGKWVPCIDPIHYDVDGSGVGPGKFFGEALAESDPSIVVGMVPTAIGGCPMSQFEPGEKQLKGKTWWHPYDDLVARTKKAQEQGTVVAILWHQGESDCRRGGGYCYQFRFPEFVNRLRKDCNLEGVPLICGGLCPDMEADWFGKILANAKRWTCEYAFGPGKYVKCPDDVKFQPDGIHYVKASQQEFAKRYFAAYQEVMKALAANKDYYKDAATNPSAKIKCVKIPGYDAGDWERQIGAVPEKLNDVVEKWCFPEGRPEKPANLEEKKD